MFFEVQDAQFLSYEQVGLAQYLDPNAFEVPPETG